MILLLKMLHLDRDKKNKYFIQFFLHLVQIFECKYRCWVKPYFHSVFLNKKLDIK